MLNLNVMQYLNASTLAHFITLSLRLFSIPLWRFGMCGSKWDFLFQRNALYPRAQIAGVSFHNDFDRFICRKYVLSGSATSQIGTMYGWIKIGVCMLAGEHYCRLKGCSKFFNKCEGVLKNKNLLILENYFRNNAEFY